MAYDAQYADNITTNEDLLHYKGIDLSKRLVDQLNDDGIDPSKRAINDVEEWLIAKINDEFDYDGDRSGLSAFQKEKFKKAVCEQIDYMLDNGDIRNLAGLNGDLCTYIENRILREKEISASALRHLRKCGLANLRRY